MWKMIKLLISILLLFTIFSSCNTKNQEKGDLNTILATIDSTDLTPLTNLSIYYVGKGENNTLRYFVNLYQGKCSPYLVDMTKDNLSIAKIDNQFVLKSCHDDYLTKAKIKESVTLYCKLNVYLLQTDEYGNVYINPFQEGSPTMMRISSNGKNPDSSKYSHYKDNWYKIR